MRGGREEEREEVCRRFTRGEQYLFQALKKETATMERWKARYGKGNEGYRR